MADVRHAEDLGGFEVGAAEDYPLEGTGGNEALEVRGGPDQRHLAVVSLTQQAGVDDLIGPRREWSKPAYRAEAVLGMLGDLAHEEGCGDAGAGDQDPLRTHPAENEVAGNRAQGDEQR